MKKYILDGGSNRNSCQRLLNFLLVDLNNSKNYFRFCYCISAVTVLTDLPYRMISGMFLTVKIFVSAVIIFANGYATLTQLHLLS